MFAQNQMTDSGKWKPRWRICRYDDEHYRREVQDLSLQAGMYLLLARDWRERAEAARRRGDDLAYRRALAREMEFRGKAERLMEKVVLKSESVSEFSGNLLLNEGINEMWTLICGGSATAYSNANAHLGVGDGTTAAAATQTGLVGTNTAFGAMETGYPSFGSNQKAVFRAVFDGTSANFAWQEFTVVNAADDTGKNMNRLVSNQGTKASGQTWTLDLTVTLS